ncbi:MAG: PAS domain S-box protein [Gemmataceae bacterium]
MTEAIARLFDPSGFVPRKDCGTWTPELIGLHVGSDLLIWLAYLSIPLVLLFLAPKVRLGRYRWLVVLFAVFILACGTTHLIEAIIFERPVYRLSGVVKAVTAVASWLTVFALIPTVPRLMAALPDAEAARPTPWRPTDESRLRGYIVALLAATLAVLIRGLLDPLLATDHAFVIPLLAVVAVSWYQGFGPGVLTLLVGMAAVVYWFVEPVNSFVIGRQSDQVAVGLFLFVGFACALLGEAQRNYRVQADERLLAVRAKQAELEAEVARRVQSEKELRVAADELAVAERRSADTLAQLDALYHHTPIGLALLDPDLRYLRVNKYLADGYGIPADAHIGRPAREVTPNLPAEADQAMREVVRTGKPSRPVTVVRGTDPRVSGPMTGEVWEATYFPVTGGDGHRIGVGVVAENVTDRVVADRALKASEERYRLATEAVRGLVYDYDIPRNRVVRSNGLRGLLGFSPGDVPNTPRWWQDRIHPDDADPDGQRFKAINESADRGFRGEYRIRHRDGRWVDVEERGLVVRDEAGRAVRIVGCTTDITDRKQAERAVRESEARFRTATQALPQIVWVTRPDGYHEYFNDRWYEFTGLTEADSLGDGWNLPLHPDDKPRTVARWQRSLATGEPYEIEYRFRGKDGAYRWFLGRAVAERDEAGQVVRWFGTLTDIDEFKRLQDEVRESEARFRTLAESMPQLAWTAHPDGHIFWYNRRWYEYTGTTPEAMEGWGWQSVHDPAELPQVLAEWKRAIATGQPFEMTFPLRGADGRFRRFLTRAHPAKDADGRVTLWFGTNTDVDQVERLQADLRASEERYRSLTELLPLVVWLADVDGRITYFNRRWYEYTGQTEAEALSPSAADAIHPDHLESVAAAWRNAVGSGGGFEVEYPLRGRDGAFRWHLSRSQPLRDAGGLVAGWIGVVIDIHDRREAVAAVRASEQRFRDLADSMPQIVYTSAADGTVNFLNRRWKEFTGSDAAGPDEMAALLHPDDGHRLATAWAAARADERLLQIDFRLKTVDGQYRWFLTRAVPIRGEDGRLAGWYGTSTDVDDLKRLQEQVQAAAERFRVLTEAIPQLVWNADAAGHITYFNRRWQEYTGLTAGHALSEWWPQVVHPDDAEGLEAAWQRAVAASPAPFSQEVRVRRTADGAYRWFQTAVIPLRRPDGSVDQWIGSLSDIDDQKRQAERLEELVVERTAELRRQREFLNAILDNVTDGIVACDADGRITLFNRASREFHGLPAEPIPPDQWAGRYDLYEPDGRTPLATDDIPLYRALRGERVRDAEMVIAARHAPPRTLLANGQPLVDAGGVKLGAVVSMRDITARKLLEERERAITLELRRSNQELEKFAYVASHDLQEPLRKVQAFGDRLKTRFGPAIGDEGGDYLDRMLKAAGRMRALINDLLAFSRITTRGQPFERVDLHQVAADVLSDLEVRVYQTGAAVDLGPLPTIDADPVQMRQLFQNLIGNALKFHKPGEPPAVTIRGELLPADDPAGEPRVRLTVADAGIGFDEKYVDRIFQVFQRLHGRDQYEGTGVGLAICRRIAERHRGEITAHSRPGHGATFAVTLPAGQPPSGPPEVQ